MSAQESRWLELAVWLFLFWLAFLFDRAILQETVCAVGVAGCGIAYLFAPSKKATP